MKAIEIIGSIDKDGTVIIPKKISAVPPGPVRILLLAPSEGDEEMDEGLWIRSAGRNSAFDFLKDPVEDIYSLSDGRTFHD